MDRANLFFLCIRGLIHPDAVCCLASITMAAVVPVAVHSPNAANNRPATHRRANSKFAAFKRLVSRSPAPSVATNLESSAGTATSNSPSGSPLGLSPSTTPTPTSSTPIPKPQKNPPILADTPTAASRSSWHATLFTVPEPEHPLQARPSPRPQSAAPVGKPSLPPGKPSLPPGSDFSTPRVIPTPTSHPATTARFQPHPGSYSSGISILATAEGERSSTRVHGRGESSSSQGHGVAPALVDKPSAPKTTISKKTIQADDAIQFDEDERELFDTVHADDILYDPHDEDVIDEIQDEDFVYDLADEEEYYMGLAPRPKTEPAYVRETQTKSGSLLYDHQEHADTGAGEELDDEFDEEEEDDAGDCGYHEYLHR